MHAEAEIKFDCGRCGQRLSADPSTAGAVTQCPSCTEPLTVPAPALSYPGRAVHHGVEDEAAAAMQALHEEVRTLQEQLNASAALRTQLEAHLASSNAEVQQVTSQLELARESIRDSAKRSQSLDKERAELLAAQEQHISQLQAFESAYAEASARIEELSTSLQAVYSELDESRAQVAGLQSELAEARSQIASVQGELVDSRKNLESSKDGREFVRLKEETDAAVRARDEAVEARMAADEQIRLLRTEVTTLSEQLKTATDSLQDAERKVAKLSDAQLQKDNVVLRSILERQKGELEQKFRELKKYQRANFGVRIAYAIIWVAVIALLAYGMQYLPLVLPAG